MSIALSRQKDKKHDKKGVFLFSVFIVLVSYVNASAQNYEVRVLKSETAESVPVVPEIETGTQDEGANLPHDEILTGDNFAENPSDERGDDTDNQKESMSDGNTLADENKSEDKNRDDILEDEIETVQESADIASPQSQAQEAANIIKREDIKGEDEDETAEGDDVLERGDDIGQRAGRLEKNKTEDDMNIEDDLQEVEPEEAKQKRAGKRKPREIVVVGSKNKEELKDDILYLPGFTITPPALPKNDKEETTASNYPSDETLPSLSINAEQIHDWSEEAKEAVRERLKEVDEINNANDFGLWIAGQALDDENILNIDIAFADLKDSGGVNNNPTVSDKNKGTRGGPGLDPPPVVIVLDDDDVKPENKMDISDRNNGGVKDGIPEFSMEIPRGTLVPEKVDMVVQTEVRFLGIFKKKTKAQISYICDRSDNGAGIDCEESVEYDLPWYMRWFSLKPSLDNYQNLSKSFISKFLPVSIGGTN